MYNEQIEALISAALADGVLTEKEKQILFKRAESMGIDLDEFEMVLDARLVEQKKKEANESKQYELEMEKARAAQKSAPKSNKFGDVRKCPSCGAMVQSLRSKCPDCGYEFVNISGNSPTQVLLEKLDAIDAERERSRSWKESFWDDSETRKDLKFAERKAQLIEMYPIPNTKEDLIEMLTLAHTSSKGNPYYSLEKAWKKKKAQIIAKADIALKDDADYLALKESWTKKKKKWGLF